jgi:hypothetical protein
MKLLVPTRHSTQLSTLAWKAKVLPLHNARAALGRYAELKGSSRQDSPDGTNKTWRGSCATENGRLRTAGHFENLACPAGQPVQICLLEQDKTFVGSKHRSPGSLNPC